jgi:hypothetical protein
MLLALAVILLQSPAVPPASMPVPSTNSAIVSVAAATDPKPETKPETKIEARDGTKKSADSEKEAGAPITDAKVIFPARSNVQYMPGRTVATPIDDGRDGDGAVADDAAAYSSSVSAEPIILAAPIRRRRPEAVGIGVPKMWFVLGAMEHGAATFDAWSTRRNIGAGTAHETNPLMRPFANSNAMYAAVQVAPVVFDLLSKHMLHSSRAWERKTWWVPQTASTVASILSGAHNMAIH